MKLGLSGWLTQRFIRSPLTPLILLAALAFGLVATLTIPREEEPQISVPMVDVRVPAPGLKAADATELVTKPLETILRSIDGVEHVYSQTSDDGVLVTARFRVGTNADAAILRVHERLRANYDRIPAGIPEPLVVGRSINDVAIMVITLSPNAGAGERWGPGELTRIAEQLRVELTKVDDVGLTYLVGATDEVIRIEPDPQRLAQNGLTLQELAGKLRGANTSLPVGRSTAGNESLTIIAGRTLGGPRDIGDLQLTTREGRTIRLRDVADVVTGTAQPDQRVWTLHRTPQGWDREPAVTIAIAKRAGANAVVVSEAVRSRLQNLQGQLLPRSLRVEITRDYGESAGEKADELLFHLGLATVSIVALIAAMVGWREGLVVAIVIPTTILMTLFAARVMGFTINRVMLFALIFSIGILVDDAVVMIENIARRWGLPGGDDRLRAAIEAVAEVGNPTVVATLTVVTALLPMLFVSGLMGPYMAPIPINASAAMVFSFFIAVTVAPWLMLKFAGKAPVKAHHDGAETRLSRLYRRIAAPVVKSRKAAWRFLLIVGVATLAACALFATKTVKVKLLPFDNKSELAVVVDLPEGATLEATERVLGQAAAAIGPVPEILSIQMHAGTAAPFNFNGLVRHYFYRNTPELGDLQVNLTPKGERRRSSHQIALDLRERLRRVALPPGSAIKVVEVPPGPPVLATLLAEVYGPDAATRRAVTRELEKLFRQVPYIVDVDSTASAPAARLRLTIDQDALEYEGGQQGDVFATLNDLMNGVAIGYSHRGEGRPPVPIIMALPRGAMTWGEPLAATPIPLNTQPGDRRVTELGDVLLSAREAASPSTFRRDGRDAEMVTADLAGAYEAPIYGMLAVQKLIDSHDWGALPKPTIRMYGQPDDERASTLLWDGEWEVTYVTFRDMGAAFGVAILGIYILVVAQFGSFRLPLVVLTPVPLTLIGIMLGHALLGAAFTATSMIGFIALAGIVVRNSILLVDFIRHGGGDGMTMAERVIEAGAVRFKPILLTALAAMIGALVILADPIFQGLAISLLFGLVSSTLLTVLVIPAIYVIFKGEPEPAPVARPQEGATQ
ncbi:MAG: efflux RND transporter permease subunit [Caulobacteraceae bacterium]